MMKGWLQRILLMLCVLSMLVSTGFAAEKSFSCLQLAMGNSKSIHVILYADASVPASDAFTVKADDTKLPVAGLTAYGDAKLGTSWLIVVDTFDAERLQSIKATASKLIAQIGEKDNVALFTSTSKAGSVALSADKTALGKQVSEIDGKSGKGPNDAIGQALNFQSEDLRPHTCLVVLSSLAAEISDASFSGYADMAEKNHVTVYAFAFAADSNKGMKAFMQLAGAGNGSLGEQVGKGSDVNVVADPLIEQIKANEQKFYVLSADSSALKAAPDKIVVSLTEGSAIHTDSIALTAAQKAVFAKAAVTKAPAETTAPPADGDEDQQQKETDESEQKKESDPAAEIIDKLLEILPWYVWGLFGLGLLVLLVLIIALIVKNSRARRKHIEPEEAEVAVSASADEDDTGATEVIGNGIALRVEITNANAQEIVTHYIEDALFIGRSAERSGIVIHGDAKVSKQHAVLKMRKGEIYLTDCSSTNGTYLNDRRLVGDAMLHTNDTIRVGETTLHINW